MPWTKWWEHTVQNSDMNAYHYIFLYSKGSLYHIPFYLLLQWGRCKNILHANQGHMHLDHENWWGHLLKCGGILLINILDIHLSSWYELQQKGNILFYNESFMLIQSIYLKISGLSSSGISTKLYLVIYTLPPSIPHLIFFMRPLLRNSHSKCFSFATSCLSKLKTILIDAADVDIFFLLLLPSPSFGSFSPSY